MPFTYGAIISSAMGFAQNAKRNSQVQTSIGYMASSNDGERNTTGLASNTQGTQTKHIKNNASQVILNHKTEVDI